MPRDITVIYNFPREGQYYSKGRGFNCLVGRKTITSEPINVGLRGKVIKPLMIFSSHREALGTALSQEVKGEEGEEEQPAKLMFLQ